MSSHFFNPKKLETSGNLILLPFFPDLKYFNKIEESAVSRKDILSSVLYEFSGYDLLYGFLGYPNLLTVLEFISNIREKNIYFLGTAGSLNPALDEPQVLNVEKIYPDSVFRGFSEDKFLTLNRDNNPGIKNVNGISVDLIQRECPEWYGVVKNMDLDIVEMELFPLRWYLKKSLTALVVLSDIVSETGIRTFNRKRISKESVNGFERILEKIR